MSVGASGSVSLSDVESDMLSPSSGSPFGGASQYVVMSLSERLEGYSGVYCAVVALLGNGEVDCVINPGCVNWCVFVRVG